MTGQEGHDLDSSVGEVQIIKLVTWNVRGLVTPTKRQIITDILTEDINPHIALIQETNINEKDINIIKNLKLKLNMGAIFHPNGRKGHSNAILSKQVMEPKISDTLSQILATTITMGSLTIALINYHGSHRPNEFKDSLENMYSILDKLGKYHGIIIGGDFNVDLISPKKNERTKANLLTTMMERLDLEMKYDDSCGGTRKNRFLDFFLISKGLVPLVISLEHKNTQYCTDHNAVIMTLAIPSKFKKSSQWYLNNSLLEDKVMITRAEGLLDSFKDKVNDYESYKRLKSKVGRLFRTEAKLKSKKKREKLAYLMNLYDYYLKSDLDERVKKIFVYDTQNRIDRHNQCLVNTVTTRSKEWMYEPHELPTKHFYRYEKLNQPKKPSPKLKNCETEDQGLEQCVQFYSDLYGHKTIDNRAMSELIDQLPKFPQRDIDYLSSEITEAEIESVIKDSDPNSSPGLDGLSFQFYIKFAKSLIPILKVIFNGLASVEVDIDTSDFFIAKMILLYKKGDNTDIRNYRPLSIINCDARLFSAILAKRLNNILPELISPVQSGFIQGRSTQDVILTTQHLIRKCQTRNETGAFLLLDWEKAYDRLSHSFLFAVIKRTCGDRNFTRWTSTVYNNSTFKICFNNKISMPIPMKSGVRQGCPMSPLLFNLCLEPLIMSIELDKSWKGLYGIKHLYFADDSTFILQDSRELERAMYHLAKYEDASGARQNKEKTLGLLINETEELKQSIESQGYKTTKETTNLLGFPIGPNVKPSEIWDEPISKAEISLNIWSKRNLSLYGKQMILNSKLLGRVIYRASMAKMPMKYVHKINKMIKGFLFTGKGWCSSTPWLEPKEIGGLGVLDIRNLNDALLTKIGIGLLQGQDTPWIHLANEETGPPQPFFTKVKRKRTKDPKFWRDISTSLKRTLVVHESEWNSRPSPSSETTIVISRNQSSIKLMHNGKSEPLEGYSTKIGRQAITEKQPIHHQLAHRRWNNQFHNDDWSRSTETSMTKYYPNYYLQFRWKLRHLSLFHFNFGTHTCIRCNKPITDVRHILTECDYAKQVWNQISIFLNIRLSDKDKILGPTKAGKLWKHRILLLIILNQLWKKFWKHQIEKIITKVEDLVSFSRVENDRYSKFYY